jgi:hypothetical protein
VRLIRRAAELPADSAERDECIQAASLIRRADEAERRDALRRLALRTGA